MDGEKNSKYSKTDQKTDEDELRDPIHWCNNDGYYRGRNCPICNAKGGFVLGGEKTYKLGKIVSGALRHFPKEFNIDVDDHGWTDINDLFKVLRKKYNWLKMRHLIGLIKSDEKERYELKGTKVRARYGHSIMVNLDDYPENDQPVLYYGTSEEEAGIILSVGLKPIRQRYVHLSKTYEKALEAASIHTDRPIILKIDAKRAQSDGIKILSATKDIALADKILPEYISKI